MKIKKKDLERWKRGIRGQRQTELIEFMKEEKHRLTYPQENWSRYNRNQTREKHRFLELLNMLVNTADIPEKPYLFGRPSLPVHDMVKCCAIKVYTNLSVRKVIPELEYAYEMRIINSVPHYNILSSYMRQKWLSKLIEELIELSALPFSATDKHFAVDATGFSNKRFTKWFDIRLGSNSKRKEFLKLSLICSTDSLIVPAAIVTAGNKADSPYFKKLVNKASDNFQIDEVYADKGYSSRDNHEIVKRKGGRAFIPFKSNATGMSRGSLEWKRAFKFWKENPEEFNKSYHRRSLNESLFSSIKRTKLNFTRSKNFTACRNEILLKVLCHNIIVLANSK